MQTGIVERALADFVNGLGEAIPAVLSGLVFLLLGGILVKAIVAGVRVALRRALPGESPVYRRFVATIVSIFLWFGIALSFLSVVGLTEIAASLGTATGFVALGVSYASSDMIADAVAGVYLLRDPDFEPGDTVATGDITGVVESIELRKTRFDVDGDTVVLGNAAIESGWTRREAAAEGDLAATGTGE
ncbi:mechanosensitive ion channel domain-containing protein [Halegenticoccus soli]|uniref:mechanosensitive ion channel domain-containing protein n=1 Tax=Halegenticoccus soli TaxID=1985678 RepID=UPI000C6E762F